MPAIETLYVVNHSHTDIGFTDHQDVCLRQHREYVDAALDLIEATADRPTESRYRWTVEVTGPLLPWLLTSTTCLSFDLRFPAFRAAARTR